MELLYSLDEYRHRHGPIVLTIGNFDGVHKGHQTVLKHITEYAKHNEGYSAVITFRNHPSTILRPDQTVPLLCSLEHRIKLLENEHIDFLFMLTFTSELAKQTAEVFLKNILQQMPFSKLILGHDAVLGKDRQGDSAKIKALSHSLKFTVDYIPPYSIGEIDVSSSKIRECIQKGDLSTAEKLLGRKYSIYSSVVTGVGKGKTIGFPTANIDVQGLCVPPLGVYAIKAIIEGKLCEGIANLGIAPTVRSDTIPILEVHLFNQEESLYGKMIEVIFYEYIRPEKRFDDISQLKAQISQDVQIAKQLLKSSQNEVIK